MRSEFQDGSFLFQRCNARVARIFFATNSVKWKFNLARHPFARTVRVSIHMKTVCMHVLEICLLRRLLQFSLVCFLLRFVGAHAHVSCGKKKVHANWRCSKVRWGRISAENARYCCRDESVLHRNNSMEFPTDKPWFCELQKSHWTVLKGRTTPDTNWCIYTIDPGAILWSWNSEWCFHEHGV